MVETIITKVTHKGDGVTTVFPYSFALASSSDVHVAIYDAETEKSTVLTSDYYVDTVIQTVTYPGYAPGQEPAESERPAVLNGNQTITIYRETARDQTTDLRSKYPLPQVEAMSDKLTLIAQELSEQLERSVKVAVGDPETPEERYLEMQTYVKDTAAAASTATAAQENAAKSASAAAGSATAAGTSAANAAASEKNAANSAAAAAQSATNAGNYASNAMTSAGSAASANASAMQYMQKAAQSATNVAGATEDAKSAAARAAVSEKNAAASETVAKNEAEVSQSYATVALGYKNETTASAGEAKTYAKAAALSATEAQTASDNSQIAEKWAVYTGSPDDVSDEDSPTGKTQSSRTWALYAKQQAQSAALVALNVQTIINDAVEVLRNGLNTENRAYIDLGETELQVVQAEAEDGTTYTTNTVTVAAADPGTNVTDVWIDLSA